MIEYFTTSMETVGAEPRHRICLKMGLVTLQQRGRDNFLVRYGRQVDAELTYSEACAKLGQALMHQAACDGELDNSEGRRRA